MGNLVCRAGLAGLLMSGCSPQSVPTVESITKPTIQTFAQLASWRPWQSALHKQQPVPVVLSEPAPEPSKPASIERQPERATRPPPKPTPVVVRVAKPVPSPASRIEPTVLPEEPSKTVPALVSCRTHNEPGQRVRMECNPVD